MLSSFEPIGKTMGYKFTHRVRIEWGDTDPARIVFYPQYFRWFDATCHRMFDELGVNQDAMVDAGGVGFPIVEAHAEFRKPGYYADWIEVRAEIAEVGRKVIKVAYQVWRDDILLLEGYEKRVIANRHPDDAKRIVAQEIPAHMRERLMA